MLKTDVFKIVESRNIKNLRTFLNKKPDAIHKTKKGDGLLHLAAQMEYSDVIEVLIQNGANVNKQNSIGRTALHISCAQGHYDGVLVLRDHGADPSIACILGDNALHEASKNGNIRIIKFLFNADFDINTQNKQGWSALHKAVFAKKEDAVEVLIQEGIDPFLKTNKDKTAYQLAMELTLFDMAVEIEKYETKLLKEKSLKAKNEGPTDDTPSKNVIDMAKILDDGKKTFTNMFRFKKPNSLNIATRGTEQSQTPTDLTTNENNVEEQQPKENIFKTTTDKLKCLLSVPKPNTVSEENNLQEATDLSEEGDNEAITPEQENEAQPSEHEAEESQVASTVNEQNSEVSEPVAKATSKNSKPSKLKFLKKSKFFKTGSKGKGKNKTTSCSKSSGGNLEENNGESDEEGGKQDEDHECPVCFEIPLPPTHIYQCMNGHLYCGNCMQMPNMFNCPQCGIDIASVRMRNRYAEENIQRLYGGKKK